jgi:lambda repressor-like predicted transcriptional regulator
MTQKRAGMHHAEIVAAIRVRCGSCAALADRLGVAKSSISHTIRRPVHSTKIERKIAEAIGVSLHAIWPDRWSEAGIPLPRSQHGQSAAPHRIKSSQKGQAA